MPRKPGAIPVLMHRAMRHKAAQPVRHPDLGEFVDLYGGLDAAQFHAELQDVDSQLDTVWPGWRHKEPFAHLPHDSLVAVKTLLVRRELLMAGNAAWGITIIHKSGGARKTKDGKAWPYCMTVPPVEVPYVAAKPEVAKKFGPRISVPHLAASCKLPIEVVEAAEACRPPDAINARDWALAYAAKQKKAKKAKTKTGGKRRETKAKRANGAGNG